MKKLLWTVPLLALSSACSNEKAEKERECEDIAAEIRKAADARGIPQQGVCNSTNPTIQKDFADACARLKRCNEEAAEL